MDVTAGAGSSAPQDRPSASAQVVELHTRGGQNASALIAIDPGVLLACIALALAASVGAGALMGRSRRGWAYRLPRPPTRP